METPPSTSNGTPETAPDLEFVSGAAQECCGLKRAGGMWKRPQLIPRVLCFKAVGCGMCGCEVAALVVVLGGCLQPKETQRNTNSVATSQTGNIFKCVLQKSRKILSPENA